MLRWLAALMIVSLPVGGAEAACPTWTTSPKGFVLTRMDGMTLEVTGRGNDIVSMSERYPDPSHLPIEKSYIRGLLPNTSKSKAKLATVNYDQSPLAIFPLLPGAAHDLGYKISSDGQPSITARLALNIATERSTVAIGPCSYPTIAVTKAVTFSNGHEYVNQEFWSEELELVLRTVVNSRLAGKEPVRLTLEFTAISARP
ncbi:MAG TPA: hypothetical protein PK264_00035 [Hyphomicrobiaceae bacterium]|nr:hypothetical protein [Hyphomicrobiaceae bacterium]